MDVDGVPACMRPQADVHLLWREELVHNARGAMQQPAELRRLGIAEVRDSGCVSFWHDDQGPDAERSNAVIHIPVLGFVDHSAR